MRESKSGNQLFLISLKYFGSFSLFGISQSEKRMDLMDCPSFPGGDQKERGLRRGGWIKDKWSKYRFIIIDFLRRLIQSETINSRTLKALKELIMSWCIDTRDIFRLYQVVNRSWWGIRLCSFLTNSHWTLHWISFSADNILDYGLEMNRNILGWLYY